MLVKPKYKKFNKQFYISKSKKKNYITLKKNILINIENAPFKIVVLILKLFWASSDI